MAILATLAAVYGGTAVALGAFGAHGLKKRIAEPTRLQNWNTAAQVRSKYAPTWTSSRSFQCFFSPSVLRSSSVLPCSLSAAETLLQKKKTVSPSFY
jgi:uncharacterized membrane protein YgdD (TMEM256/DUF423 family)